MDALGNPTSLHLTPGQASDLEEADALLGAVSATTWIAAKGYDQRVLTRLQQAGKTAVIPPRTIESQQNCQNFLAAIYFASVLIWPVRCPLGQSMGRFAI